MKIITTIGAHPLFIKAETISCVLENGVFCKPSTRFTHIINDFECPVDGKHYINDSEGLIEAEPEASGSAHRIIADERSRITKCVDLSQ